MNTKSKETKLSADYKKSDAYLSADTKTRSAMNKQWRKQEDERQEQESLKKKEKRQLDFLANVDQHNHELLHKTLMSVHRANAVVYAANTNSEFMKAWDYSSKETVDQYAAKLHLNFVPNTNNKHFTLEVKEVHWSSEKAYYDSQNPTAESHQKAMDLLDREFWEVENAENWLAEVNERVAREKREKEERNTRRAELRSKLSPEDVVLLTRDE